VSIVQNDVTTEAAKSLQKEFHF